MLKVDSCAINVSLDTNKWNIDKRSFNDAILRIITPNYFRPQLDTWEQFTNNITIHRCYFYFDNPNKQYEWVECDFKRFLNYIIGYTSCVLLYIYHTC